MNSNSDFKKFLNIGLGIALAIILLIVILIFSGSKNEDSNEETFNSKKDPHVSDKKEPITTNKTNYITPKPANIDVEDNTIYKFQGTFNKSKEGDLYFMLAQVSLFWKPLNTGISQIGELSSHDDQLNNIVELLFANDKEINSQFLKKFKNYVETLDFMEFENVTDFYNLFRKFVYQLNFYNMVNFINDDTYPKDNEDILNVTKIKDINSPVKFDPTTVLNFYIITTRLLTIINKLVKEQSYNFRFDNFPCYPRFMENFNNDFLDKVIDNNFNVDNIKVWVKELNDFLKEARSKLPIHALRSAGINDYYPVDLDNVSNIIIHTKNNIIEAGFKILDQRYILVAGVIESESTPTEANSEEGGNKSSIFYQFSTNINYHIDSGKTTIDISSISSNIAKDGSKTLFYQQIL